MGCGQRQLACWTSGGSSTTATAPLHQQAWTPATAVTRMQGTRLVLAPMHHCSVRRVSGAAGHTLLQHQQPQCQQRQQPLLLQHPPSSRRHEGQQRRQHQQQQLRGRHLQHHQQQCLLQRRPLCQQHQQHRPQHTATSSLGLRPLAHVGPGQCTIPAALPLPPT